MLETIDEKVTPEKIINEEIIYQALGFIPEEFRYKEGLVEMYLGQVAGYYNPDKDHLVMAKWMPAIDKLLTIRGPASLNSARNSCRQLPLLNIGARYRIIRQLAFNVIARMV